MSERYRIFVRATIFTWLIGFILIPYQRVRSSDNFRKYSKRNLFDTSLNILETSHAFTEIAAQVIPTVVSIHSTLIVRARDLWQQRLEGNGLNDLLGDKYYNNHSFPREFRQKGSGSGIIVSEDGYILTNVHVVENAEVIEVALSDKRRFIAEIVGTDPLTEVAVIKIAAENLTAAKIGDSKTCRIGEWVLAVGNPMELNSTITAGIISAMGRDINIIRDTYGVENFIQTDAAINPGNSGGALVNLQGEVIGVNTAIATENGYSQGYGFAIPINLANEIMNDLIHNGRVVRGYLGISMQDMDEKKARALGMSEPAGVFIDGLSDDGPALEAGLREKDVLLKIDSEPVNSANIVQSIITQRNPGEKIMLTIIRNSRIIELPVALGERQQPIRVRSVVKKKNHYKNYGLSVEEIDSQIARDLGIEKDYGIIVTAVERFSPVYEAGIHVHDIILEIGDKKILTMKSYRHVIKNLKKDRVVILKLLRDDTTFHAFVDLSSK